MSKPSAGRYVIYNRILSPTGQKLALTYPGQQNQALKVTALTNAANQIWNIRDNDANTSVVSPDQASRNEVGWGEGSVPMVMSPGGYVWAIQSTDSGFIIQDGGKTKYWNLGGAQVDNKVNIEADNGTLSRWIFEKV